MGSCDVLNSRFLDREHYSPTLYPNLEDDFGEASPTEELAPDPYWKAALQNHAMAEAVFTPSPTSRSKIRTASPAVAAQGPAFLHKNLHVQIKHSLKPWIAACSVLGVLLLMQVMVFQRNWWAAHYPSSRFLFNAVCTIARCEIEPWQSIEDIQVESSSLAPVPANREDIYKLSVLLRNRAWVGVATPSVELTIKGIKNEVVARRVISPKDFKTTASIDARDELNLSVKFSTRGHAVSGYSIETFYP